MQRGNSAERSLDIAQRLVEAAGKHCMQAIREIERLRRRQEI
jgi:hypothetical protein